MAREATRIITPSSPGWARMLVHRRLLILLLSISTVAPTIRQSPLHSVTIHFLYTTEDADTLEEDADMLEDELKESDGLEDIELEVELDDTEMLTDAAELDEVVAEPNNKTLYII